MQETKATVGIYYERTTGDIFKHELTDGVYVPTLKEAKKKRAEGGLEDVPTLSQYQSFCRHTKSKRVAGVQIEVVLELRQGASQHALPAKFDDIEPRLMYAIPMEYSKFPSVEAVALTSKTQVGWIVQLHDCIVRYRHCISSISGLLHVISSFGMH